jgi:hypothetical protein
MQRSHRNVRGGVVAQDRQTYSSVSNLSNHPVCAVEDAARLSSYRRSHPSWPGHQHTWLTTVRRNFKIEQILHFQSEILRIPIGPVTKRGSFADSNFNISVFGLEMEDSSDFKVLLRRPTG